MAESHSSEAHGHGDAPSYDDINVPVIILVGAISAVATLISIMFIQGLCYHWQNSFIRTRSAEVENTASVAEVQRQKDTLQGGEGIVPIDDAIDKVIARYGG
ncbi:MAG: hypothetical protein AAF939_04635 [Planctomycetota bacterium]